jgi:hypothetical protein
VNGRIIFLRENVQAKGLILDNKREYCNNRLSGSIRAAAPASSGAIVYSCCGSARLVVSKLEMVHSNRLFVFDCAGVRFRRGHRAYRGHRG